MHWLLFPPKERLAAREAVRQALAPDFPVSDPPRRSGVGSLLALLVVLLVGSLPPVFVTRLYENNPTAGGGWLHLFVLPPILAGVIGLRWLYRLERREMVTYHRRPASGPGTMP